VCTGTVSSLLSYNPSVWGFEADADSNCRASTRGRHRSPLIYPGPLVTA
jgi:hypothetical protein